MLKAICVAMFALSFLLLAVAFPCAGTATNAGRSTETEQFSFLPGCAASLIRQIIIGARLFPLLPRPRPAEFAVAPNPSSEAPAVVPLYD